MLAEWFCTAKLNGRNRIKMLPGINADRFKATFRLSLESERLTRINILEHLRILDDDGAVDQDIRNPY
jgi:hypothetical protein